MQSAFIVTNGGLDETNNFAQLFRTKEEAEDYARLMRINARNNMYEVEVPEREEQFSVLITHENKRKSVQYVSSQEEGCSLATGYYKEKYDEYLAESLRTKSCNYSHQRVKSVLLFQPNCTILQLFGGGMEGAIRGASFSCISGIKYEE